ncbi:ABC transporter substrate-binding protein [Pararhodobacter sp.]|uniref:MlaC/ttg2D family ABC transporter substrate-binding protein n=1 Tax=Pararhodobacter sp. TaxID=2127056 RepID=UPI002AFE168D|nr:ABC transporter substrate-binding protein [Pararhodobacter sp.]
MLVPTGSNAMTQAQARALIDRVMTDVHSIINSGASESQMFSRFERLFDDYADVPIIARSALGPPARSASASQMTAFTRAFRGYMARKYGRQFRRFIGATAQVNDARPLQSFWEVDTTMTMRGEAPFEVRWHVSDRGGSNRFFNIIIEGVNVLAAERQEIGSMLERRGGNLDRMTQDLLSAG